MFQGSGELYKILFTSGEPTFHLFREEAPNVGDVATSPFGLEELGLRKFAFFFLGGARGAGGRGSYL